MKLNELIYCGVILLCQMKIVYGLLHPIILVPGDGGSQVEAKLVNKTDTVNFFCYKNSDWFSLWLNLEQMVPKVVDCWVDNMRMQYDTNTRKTRNNKGVETRIPGFGNTTTVEWLDKSMRSFSSYFSAIAEQLVTLGYQRGASLHGAPYDFRKAANEQKEYFVQVKKLIEDTYESNQQTQVILLTHSMGSSMMLFFLLHQSQEWKDKYVRSMINLAGPWGGTARAMKVFAVGDDLGAWLLSEKKLMWQQRTSPSLAWVMPQVSFWDEKEVLVETPEKNYTLNDYKDFFNDLGEPNGWFMRQDTEHLLEGLPPPNVEVFCLHGSGVETTEKLIYKSGEFPGSDPSTIIKGNGDGTVNYRSLIGCTRWNGLQTQPVTHHEFPGVDHLEILRNNEPATFIKNLVNNLNKQMNSKRFWSLYLKKLRLTPKIELV